MPGSNNTPLDLNMAIIEADIITAGTCLSESKDKQPKVAKYLRGLAGYHIQQACEKLIKIQIYANINKVDYKQIYKHDLSDLVSYASSQGVVIVMPKFIKDHLQIITSWEAEGRYDIHIVVKTNTIQRYLEVLQRWFADMKESGYK